jgi:probable HAF family extracellular repeat protein
MPHAFLHSNGVMTDLGTLGGAFSVGLAINTSGQVTGESATATEIRHAFLYSNGVMRDLGTLGGSLSTAQAINDAGQVAGAAYLPGDIGQHAFLYSEGVMTDLGTLGGQSSAAFAINNAGQVTGGSSMPVGSDPESRSPDHAFLYTNGVLLDLNALIPSGTGWTLTTGWAINDRGQITGIGNINGEAHAFLLTPVATKTASVQLPIAADGSSVFNAKRGVVPVRFALAENGAPTCQLPPATIAITRTAGGTIGPVDESVYVAAADSGSDFRISNCQYVYNLAASVMGPGRYRVDISIGGTIVGHAEFSLR